VLLSTPAGFDGEVLQLAEDLATRLDRKTVRRNFILQN
jgi:hypothetical protein